MCSCNAPDRAVLNEVLTKCSISIPFVFDFFGIVLKHSCNAPDRTVLNEVPTKCSKSIPFVLDFFWKSLKVFM